MRKRLKKLRALIKEAEHLQAEYNDIICFPREPVQDAVKDYRTGYPHTVSISGQGDSSYIDVRHRLYEKHRQILAEIAFLERWLDSVSDPEIRDILRLQYIRGLTQEEIAAELGYGRSAIAMKIKQFWDQ